MTREEEKRSDEQEPGRIPRRFLDEIIRMVRTTPSRMPDGGWFAGAAFAGENWRVTTIARRYRDQALRVIRNSSESLPPPWRTGDCGSRSSAD